MEKPIEFKVGKNTLRGKLFVPEGKGPFPSVIFFHGSGSQGETFFKAGPQLAQHGIVSFVFNFSGCGVSDGDFSEQKVEDGITDAQAGIEIFLAQKEVDKNRIGICGSSYGGFLAALFSSQYEFKSLMLIAPAAYSKNGLKMTHEEADKERGNFYESDSYKAVGKFTGAFFLIRCELDSVIPPLMPEEYSKSAKNANMKEEVVLRGAQHSLKTNPHVQQIGIDKMVEWFSKTL